MRLPRALGSHLATICQILAQFGIGMLYIMRPWGISILSRQHLEPPTRGATSEFRAILPMWQANTPTTSYNISYTKVFPQALRVVCQTTSSTACLPLMQSVQPPLNSGYDYYFMNYLHPSEARTSRHRKRVRSLITTRQHQQKRSCLQKENVH